MEKLKKIFSFALVTMLVHFYFGCGKIVVTGKVNGEVNNSTVDVTNLTVTRGDAEAVNTKRLYSFDGDSPGRDVRLPAALLDVDISGNPNNLQETYNFIQFISDAGAFNGGVSHSKSFIENNFGKIFYLSIPQQDGNKQSTSSATSHIGAAELFIIQNDDRFIPWQIDTGTNRCFPTGTNDCFDMRTFTRSLFSSLVNGVEPQVESLFTNPQVSLQQLRYVPHVIHQGFENDGRRARGFGLVYYAEISIITGKAYLYIPMKFLFLDDVNGYQFFIDPLDKTDLTPGESFSKSIYVKGDLITSLLETTIRDSIEAAISRISSNEIIPGIDNSEIIMASINAATGQTTQQTFDFRTKPINDFVLIPEDGANGYPLNTVLWEKSGDGNITNLEKVKLIFLE